MTDCTVSPTLRSGATLPHVRHRRHRLVASRQPAGLRRTRSSFSTAARIRPASPPPTAASSTCRRPRARCARRTAPATCAPCSAPWASATCATRPGATPTSEQEAQPFYVNAPYGIVLVHNGNLTNTRELTEELFHIDRRHLNTDSDTELLVNVLANELQAQVRGTDLDPDQVFDAIERLHERVEGSYAAIALIAGHGLLAFRDPFGIRPLVLGRRTSGLVGDEWIVATESLVLESGGYEIVRDVAPGEAVFITRERRDVLAAVRDEPAAHPVLVRVRLPRPPRLDHERHLGLRRAPAPRRPPRRHDRAVHAERATSTSSCRSRTRRAPPPCRSRRSSASSTARASTRTATSAAPSSCPGRRERKKSVKQKLNAMGSRVQGQEHPHRRRLDRARHDLEGDRRDGPRRPAPTRSPSPRRRRRCASRTSTASTCRRGRSSSRTAARSPRSRPSSAPTT